MTDLVTVWKDVNTSVSIKATSIEYEGTKYLEPFPDDDGVIAWRDSNRYLEQYTITGVVTTLADVENLKAAQQIVMGATYVKVRVYDKSANPFYNDYSPVQFPRLRAHRLSDSEWEVTCVFQW